MAELKEPLLIFTRAYERSDRTAIIDRENSYTYGDLLNASASVATSLLGDYSDLKQQRVAFVVESGFDYVAVLWGIWRAGGVAVPLSPRYPAVELDYLIENAEPSFIIACRNNKSTIAPLGKKHDIVVINSWDATSGYYGGLPMIDATRDALIIYTSGTTSKPKGAVLTHLALEKQITTLVGAWDWNQKDQILNVLPMHHVHGIVNVLSCALWAGACCEMHTAFDAKLVWERIGSSDISLFMAVPTMYQLLAEHFVTIDEKQQSHWRKAARKMRLFVSGSAALPSPLFTRWHELTGQKILERYGMTEIGMALSNPLKGERRAGSVGQPLPEVQIRLINEKNQLVEEDEEPGEIQVKSPGMFREYWNASERTRQAFTESGWFKTGDLAVRDKGYYRILGRTTVDIIKTGGFKVSALEVEQVLLQHESIQEVAVVGVPDDTWGERVAAAIIEKDGSDITPGWLRGWAKQFLVDYKVPTMLLKLNSLPRNPMGKVNKPALVELFDAESRI